MECGTMAAIQGGDEFRNWTLDSHLLASIVDAVNANTYTLHSAHSKKQRKPPTPVQRPKARVKKKGGEFGMLLAAKKKAREGN